MVFPQNMLLALTAAGIATGFLKGFLMVHHFRTGVAIMVCLLLGLYALALLPINYAGVGLIMLGIGLMEGATDGAGV